MLKFVVFAALAIGTIVGVPAVRAKVMPPLEPVLEKLGLEHKVADPIKRRKADTEIRVILHQLKRIQPALDDFNAALRMNPEQADAYLNRGVAKITLGQYADALVDIQKGIDLGPSEIALGYYDRAIAHERLGNIREAYFDYQRALKAAPNFQAAATALTRFKVTPRT